MSRLRWTSKSTVKLAEELTVQGQHMSGTLLAERYFAGRTDGLRPSSGEDLLVATT
jgi:hypothetical protein